MLSVFLLIIKVLEPTLRPGDRRWIDGDVLHTTFGGYGEFYPLLKGNAIEITWLL